MGKAAKVAQHSDLQKLHPIQIIAMWDWRQRFSLGSCSQHCPLQQGCVTRTSRHSLAPKQRQTAAMNHDRQQRSENGSWTYYSRPRSMTFCGGLWRQGAFSLVWQRFLLKSIPLCKVMQPFLCSFLHINRVSLNNYPRCVCNSVI